MADAALYRKNDRLRVNAKLNPYALTAWCWQVLATANQGLPQAGYEPGTVTPDFLRETARLSWSAEGPRLAQKFLAQHGIPLVIERHLSRTYLDGAALRLGDGRPVIAPHTAVRSHRQLLVLPPARVGPSGTPPGHWRRRCLRRRPFAAPRGRG